MQPTKSDKNNNIRWNQTKISMVLRKIKNKKVTDRMKMEAYPSNSHSESHSYEAATVKSQEFRWICRERKWEERENCVEMKKEKMRPVT